MDVAAGGLDETGHVDEFFFGGGVNPKVRFVCHDLGCDDW